MSWDKILNHQQWVDRFRRNVVRRRLANTYLFVGPDGIGKRMFAFKLAEAILCEQNQESDLEPCGKCPGCLQVLARTHPDLIVVSKPRNKSVIPVELMIGPQERRRQIGLIHDMGFKPSRGRRKIAIIEDADFLNVESANSLLKTLEEPPPYSLLILIGTSQQRQLPTIVSRSQVIRFEPLTNTQVKLILEQNRLIESDVRLDDLANASEGSIETAIRLSDPEVFDFRLAFVSQLATLDPQQGGYAKVITDFAKAAGKDAEKQRARLVLIGEFAISFYRHCYRQLVSPEIVFENRDPGMERFVESALSDWQGRKEVGAEALANCITRCTKMQRDVSANTNAANNVEVWLRDLGRICRGDSVAI